MKNKKILILLVGIIAIIAIVCAVVLSKKNKNNTQIGETKPNTVLKVEAPAKELPEETADITLYIGQEETYTQIYAKYNENANKQEQVKRLLEKIGLTIGYKLEINRVEVTDEKILIDFKSTSAPFNDSAYFGNEEDGLFIEDYKTLVYRIFDSIKVTLQSHFGENVKIYYTVDGNSMRFTNITPQLTIGENVPYGM